MRQVILVLLLLGQFQISVASFYKYGILIENGVEDDHDYVELGEVWAKDSAAVDELELKLNKETIVDFLFSDSRVLNVEDIYEIEASVKKTKVHARWLTVYELDGEIAMLANFVAFMIGQLHGSKGLIITNISPTPILFRKNQEPLLEATKIRLQYIIPVVGYDLEAARKSITVKKSGKVHDGYELLLDGESNVVDCMVCCNGCIIS